MENRKEKLITILSRAIHSLENNIVSYNWVVQSRCNCGVVLQAATGLTADELQIKWNKAVSKIGNKDFLKAKDWRTLVQSTCSASGVPVEGVLKMLYDLGISPEDIAHLEYMSNPAILKAGNVSIENVKKVTLHKKETVARNKKGTLRHFFYGPQNRIIPEREEIEHLKYFRASKNLVKYLRGWKSILKEDVSENVAIDTNTLRKKLLQAVANEDYKLAASLRDKLSD